MPATASDLAALIASESAAPSGEDGQHAGDRAAAVNAPPAPPPPANRDGSTSVVGEAAFGPGRPMGAATRAAMARARGRSDAPHETQRPGFAQSAPVRAYTTDEQQLRAALGVDEVERRIALLTAENKMLSRYILSGKR